MRTYWKVLRKYFVFTGRASRREYWLFSAFYTLTKLVKEVEKLKNKHVELLAYDEQLRHHADSPNEKAKL